MDYLSFVKIFKGHYTRSSDPWGPYLSSNKDFPGLIRYYETIALNPDEAFSIFGFEADVDKKYKELGKIDSKMVIYFGSERPVESRISISFKN